MITTAARLASSQVPGPRSRVSTTCAPGALARRARERRRVFAWKRVGHPSWTEAPLTTTEKCFLCGEERPTRPHRVELSTTHVIGSSSIPRDEPHGHHHHGTGSQRQATRELRQACAGCIRKDIETAKVAIKPGGAVLGGRSLLMLAGCLAPFVLIAIAGTVLYFKTH